MPEHIATRHKTLIMDSDRVTLVERVKRIAGPNKCWACLKQLYSASNVYCRRCRALQDQICLNVNARAVTIFPAR